MRAVRATGRPFLHHWSKWYVGRMKWIAPTLLLLTAACNREERPQAPTAAESDRLDEAEDMLNDLANEEGAAPDGTAPYNSPD